MIPFCLLLGDERLGCTGLAPEGLNGIDRNMKQRLLFVFAWLVKESRAHNFNFPGKLTAEAEESGNQFAAGETEAWRGDLKRPKMAPLSNLLADNKRKAAAKKRARNVAQGGIGEESGGQDKECGEEEKENNNKDERRQPPTSMSLSLLHVITRVEMAQGGLSRKRFPRAVWAS